jgi:hypothetical protein
VLDAELEALLLSKAAQFGLPGAWVSRLDKLDPERRQVLRVRTCVALSHAAVVLKVREHGCCATGLCDWSSGVPCMPWAR